MFTCLQYSVQPREKQDKCKLVSPGAHQHRRKKNSFVRIQCFPTPGFQTRLPTFPRAFPGNEEGIKLQLLVGTLNFSVTNGTQTSNLEQDFQKTARASSLYSQKKNNKSQFSRTEVTWTTYSYCCISLHEFSF